MRIEEEFLPPCAWCVPSDSGKYTYADAPMCQLHRACYILVGVRANNSHANELNWMKRNAFPRGIQTLSSQCIVEEFETASKDFRDVMNSRTPPHL